MPTLQIRDLPEHIYTVLVERAKRERRSLSRQAVVELERMPEVVARSRRLAAIRVLRSGTADRVEVTPETIVRADRDR